VANLQQAHARLVDLLIEDEREATRMESLSLKLESALKTANEDVLEFVSGRHSGTSLTPNTETGYNNMLPTLSSPSSEYHLQI
jgi:hypothetical protein